MTHLFRLPLLIVFCLAFVMRPSAQNSAAKQRLAVLHVDAHGFVMEPEQMGHLTRLTVDKMGLFEVLDRYDVRYMAEKEQLNFANCYGKICLVEMGRKLRADKMLTGSVELLGERIVVSFRLIDVGTETVERSQVTEFLNLRNQVQLMIDLALRQLFAQPVDEALLTKLTKPGDYESSLNVPQDVAKLNLSGPRMGMTVFSGDAARRLGASSAEGGLNLKPVMFQFGYQFETSYLNQGNLQALFEFIPIVTGLDQGQILPSISILHGVRSNRSGWEFAFGPILYLSQQSEGFYNSEDKWTRLKDWQRLNPDLPAPDGVIKTFDSRGQYALSSSFLFAFGKSFKSGKMNIPLNVFFIPNRDGHRFGLSAGFNGRG